MIVPNGGEGTGMAIKADDLLLARAAHWERTTPDKVFLTQPHSGGQTTDYTWRQV